MTAIGCGSAACRLSCAALSCRKARRLAMPVSGSISAAVLVDATRERALTVAEQIRTSFANATYELDGRPIVTTVSIGVVISYDAVLDISALLAQADHALYRAKDNGRNRIEVASIELILDRAKRISADTQGIRPPARSAA